jgi:hypothetical protein
VGSLHGDRELFQQRVVSRGRNEHLRQVGQPRGYLIGVLSAIRTVAAGEALLAPSVTRRHAYVAALTEDP